MRPAMNSDLCDFMDQKVVERPHCFIKDMKDHAVISTGLEITIIIILIILLKEQNKFVSEN